MRVLAGLAVELLDQDQPQRPHRRQVPQPGRGGSRLCLLTVGLGTLPGEAAAVGVDFTTRGRRADEAIDVLRLLWIGDAAGVSFQGEFFSLTAACSFPKPHDGRILPVHVGGSSLAAARRAGRRGDGYFPSRPSLAGHVVRGTQLVSQPSAAGRQELVLA